MFAAYSVPTPCPWIDITLSECYGAHLVMLSQGATHVVTPFPQLYEKDPPKVQLPYASHGLAKR